MDACLDSSRCILLGPLGRLDLSARWRSESSGNLPAVSGNLMKWWGIHYKKTTKKKRVVTAETVAKLGAKKQLKKTQLIFRGSHRLWGCCCWVQQHRRCSFVQGGQEQVGSASSQKPPIWRRWFFHRVVGGKMLFSCIVHGWKSVFCCRKSIETSSAQEHCPFWGNCNLPTSNPINKLSIWSSYEVIRWCRTSWFRCFVLRLINFYYSESDWPM